MTAKKIGIFVLLSKATINWDNKNIQVVLLLAIIKEDRTLLENYIKI